VLAVGQHSTLHRDDRRPGVHGQQLPHEQSSSDLDQEELLVDQAAIFLDVRLKGACRLLRQVDRRRQPAYLVGVWVLLPSGFFHLGYPELGAQIGHSRG